ncbi:MAG: hypothetical protein GFH27_549279n424 [Chloroflexi bacterium AL-W]|nr:hypothetical protein [Chloroflexi bacterium AL-N1]NOK65390.1 hypothetical protein [Chloroflexi bacterium AL-N10]NOK72344.1 hypothetical protein [Chloroflexi bacterium AL-N5]NOK79569.1 hypothetical protein [Chloroflexi bacterium AL-W]NOK87485.1 hypothetical protein [Chloroflexi bacterium AL-N15]
MFLLLLLATFLIALGVSFVVVRLFTKPIDAILSRIITDSIRAAWQQYLTFAMYVVGISSGVRIWELEQYITPPLSDDSTVITLTMERWILEIYRTILSTLQGLAWLLLVFFVFALIAYVIVRIVSPWATPTSATCVISL